MPVAAQLGVNPAELCAYDGGIASCTSVRSKKEKEPATYSSCEWGLQGLPLPPADPWPERCTERLLHTGAGTSGYRLPARGLQGDQRWALGVNPGREGWGQWGGRPGQSGDKLKAAPNQDRRLLPAPPRPAPPHPRPRGLLPGPSPSGHAHAVLGAVTQGEERSCSSSPPGCRHRVGLPGPFLALRLASRVSQAKR